MFKMLGIVLASKKGAKRANESCIFLNINTILPEKGRRRIMEQDIGLPLPPPWPESWWHSNILNQESGVKA
jgi:hypothetical protein